jgi:hypothetical protein
VAVGLAILAGVYGADWLPLRLWHSVVLIGIIVTAAVLLTLSLALANPIFKRNQGLRKMVHDDQHE